MRQDISHQQRQIGAARTPARRGYVQFAWDGQRRIDDADVLILRDASDVLCAARFIGYRSEPVADGDEVLALVGAWRVSDQGETLSAILGGASGAGTSDAEGHDWGAMGLPEGLETPMRRLEVTDLPNDVDMARRSAGSREFMRSRVLSLAPGDMVTIRGSTGTLVTIDRRKRRVEIETDDGEMLIVALDELEEVEQAE